MRMFKYQLAGLALLAFTTVAAASETARFNACRDEAKAIADDYVAAFIEPATDVATAPQGSFVFIGYGDKFIVPLNPANNGDLHVHGTGEMIAKRAQVYHEELARCLGLVNLKVVVRQ